ncbi:MAG: esterase [Betaproteobacteria bacterium]|nr:esterase [Betaproteobacteria bacterium]
MFIYIHGFNSSPQSTKARQLKARLESLGRGAQYWCPALPDRPAQAMALLEFEVMKHRPETVTLVGSSLGGFYSTCLVEKHGVRAVLLNPAIVPHEGLEAYLGPQKNLYTGEAYELTREHLAELRTFHVPEPKRLDNYYVMVATGDEVLDYRHTISIYAGARQLVIDGSDHGFAEFENYLDSVMDFASRR